VILSARATDSEWEATPCKLINSSAYLVHILNFETAVLKYILHKRILASIVQSENYYHVLDVNKSDPRDFTHEFKLVD